MKTPETVYEGDVSEATLSEIVELIKKLFGRKGRILFVDNQ